MKRQLAALLIVGAGLVVACAGPPAAQSPSPSPTIPPSPSPSANAWIATCEQGTVAGTKVQDELLAMLQSFIDDQNKTDPADARPLLDSIDHMKKAYELASKGIRDLPDGYESEPRLKTFADKLRTVQGLTGAFTWTPKQVSDAGVELIDATAALGDCTASTANADPVVASPPAFVREGKHGTHVVAVNLPAGPYRLEWRAEGKLPDQRAAGCDFDIKAGDTKIASHAVAEGATASDTGTVELPVTTTLWVEGIGCTWSVSLTAI